MIQSTQELPLILPTNISDITFLNDEIKTRSATCSGWLNHTEGTSQYTILGSGNCNCPNVYKITFNANVTGATAGSIEIGLKENGTPVVGASVNEVVTPDEYQNVSFTKVIRLCPRENVTLTIGSIAAVSGVVDTPIETVPPTIKNANLIIEKVRC
jgi:hypothetical protein